MAYASTAGATLNIRMPRAVGVPHVPLPKWRWPSPRARALMMLALMFSPCVLSNAMGYWVQRIFYTADQIEDRQAPDTLLAKINMFDVACPASSTSAREHVLWARYSAEQGWPLYEPAGPGCFRPNRNLRGVAPLKVFTVACPRTVLSAVDQHRWLVFVADRKWTPYPQAGVGCVDP